MNGDRGGQAWGPGQGAASDYDQVVDWPRRLAREAPFFEKLFDQVGAREVLDVGCGTGMHAIEFARWGLDVFAVDPSEAMLVQARENARDAGISLTIAEGRYGELAALLEGRRVDATVSLGNAFQHVEGPDGLPDVLRDLAATLRPGGVLVLHFLNHDRLLSRRPRILGSVFRETDAGDKVFLKLLSYEEDRILFDMVTLSRREDAQWDVSARRSAHTALPVGSVIASLASEGFHDVTAYGSHDGAPFEIDEDESVILVAYRD